MRELIRNLLRKLSNVCASESEYDSRIGKLEKGIQELEASEIETVDMNSLSRPHRNLIQRVENLEN